jgi:type III pantothenate kinase
MRILIDVGNSVTKVVLNKDHKITIVKSINYIKKSRYESELKKTIKSIILKNKISDVFTSSVNREALKIIKNVIAEFKDLKFINLKSRELQGFKIKYKKIEKFGIDRFYNCLGARSLSVKNNFIIFDIGTATTIDVIDKKFNYLGGLIIPGPLTSFSSLIGSTSMIGKHNLLINKKLLGLSTEQCLSSGFIQSNSSMIDSLCKKISKEFGLSFKVIITGGLSDIFSRYISIPHNKDKFLIFKGMIYFIENDNKYENKNL